MTAALSDAERAALFALLVAARTGANEHAGVRLPQALVDAFGWSPRFVGPLNSDFAETLIPLARRLVALVRSEEHARCLAAVRSVACDGLCDGGGCYCPSHLAAMNVETDDA